MKLAAIRSVIFEIGDLPHVNLFNEEVQHIAGKIKWVNVWDVPDFYPRFSLEDNLVDLIFFVILFRAFGDNRDMEVRDCVLQVKEAEPHTQEIDFEAWMAEEQERIFLLCLRLLRNRDEADSATQDVFVEAYKTLRKNGLGSIQEPPKWLTRVAYNTCYDLIRSKRWRFWQSHSRNDSGDDLFRRMPAAGLNQEDTASAQEIRERLEIAYGRLSLRQKMVFVFRHEEQRSYEEIAGIMSLDTGTVKAHMSRAIKKLREELRDLYVR